MSKNISYLFVLLAALLWGSIAAIGKLLLADLDNFQILFFTIFFAFISLFFIVFFQKKISIIKSYTKRDYLTFAWMGFLGIFFYPFFFYSALQLLSAQEAFIINYLWPIMVVVFTVLILKEKMTLKKIVGIICSFVGVIIVITKGDFSSLQFGSTTGILFAITGAIAYSLFSVFDKKQNYEKFTSMMFYYLFSFFCALIAVLFFSKIPMISTYQLIGLIWLGVFVNGLALAFWFFALKYGDAIKMSNMIFLTPFISLVYIYFLVGEKILASSVIGLMVIVTGIVIQSIGKNLPSKKLEIH